MAMVALKAMDSIKNPTHLTCPSNNVWKPKVFRSGTWDSSRVKERILSDSDCNSFLVEGSHLATSTSEGENKFKKMRENDECFYEPENISHVKNLAISRFFMTGLDDSFTAIQLTEPKDKTK